MKSEYFVDFENGNFQQQDPLFIKFIDYLKTLGINALYVVFENSNCMVVEVLTPSEVLNANEIFKLNGEIILDKFFSLIEEFNAKLFFEKSKWSPNHFIDFSSFDFVCIDRLARRSRKKVIQELNEVGIYPREVFCRNTDSNYSILPGYYIFFKTPEELKRIDDSMKQVIKRVCDKVLAEEDKSGFFEPYKIEIGYMDAVTDGYSLGHLSRDVD